MASRDDLVDWVLTALKAIGGSASVPDIARQIWLDHERELKASGNLFYTWQYDMRWAANKLRNDGKLEPANFGKRGYWTAK
jgi:hypothetical protein